MDMKNDFLNKINSNQQSNTPLFGNDPVGAVHEKVMNSLRGKQQHKAPESQINPKAEQVMKADMRFRDSLRDLAMALEELDDVEIAKKLLGEHVVMLSTIYKHFE